MMTMLPSLATEDIRRAMTSTRFDPSSGDPLAKTLFRYVHAAEVLNTHFPTINSTQCSLLPFSSNKGKKTLFEEVFAKGKVFDAFLAEHHILRRLMELDSPWVFEKLDKINVQQEFVWWDPRLPELAGKYIKVQEVKRRKATEERGDKTDDRP